MIMCLFHFNIQEKTEAEKRDKQKMDKERRQAELNMLFKPVEQKVPKGKQVF